MQAGTTKDFVALAKSRPITLERQKQFAIARTQAQLKCSREDAEKLVEEVWDLPLDQLRIRKEQHGVDQPTRYAEHQQQVRDTPPVPVPEPEPESATETETAQA